MAEAAAAFTESSTVTGGWTKHVSCRYFLHGLCKEGDNCRYSHDLTNSKPVAMICKFFQKGNCMFGDRCRFEHCKPPQNEELPNSQTVPLPSMSQVSLSDPEQCRTPPGPGAKDWANAAEFVPGQPYCGRVGECRYGINCAYLHGDVCDMCGLQVLHPTDSNQRSEHTKACIEAHEKDMEISFAIQRSKDMMCGVCMEVVFEKANPSERRFGILSNCSHCYCLKCIRKWRSAKQFESKIIKSCPECRITSNFVIPSEYWVEDKDDKQKLIQKYKDGMGSKPCRYFDEGRGTCPFGSNCFYKHAFPDGRLETAQPPRRQTGSNSRSRNSRRTPLWDIFDERESTDSFDNEDDDMVTFELSEMLLMLLAAGTDDEVTDSEDEWDLFHEELDDFYEIYL
ncbi:probable E3 ubiquitin-protein ligase makorin-1 isoform X2 [Betta splendens]|uniref:RING-type E3 ubiquitin transferase n=1 Tax=Betta splendens TaxID=158456 RepID=A0A6P7NAN2_BETSP|nr:probable E3 ubiquitin-protein ligase makorin-1 isoform X2 [Betta splendens]